MTLATGDGSRTPQPGEVWRIGDRATFAELRRRGRRRRSGALQVVWVPGPPTRPPRVAYAIGRQTGPAVVRNRVRRRLRAIASEFALQGRLAPGDYLVIASATAARASFATLRDDLGAACTALRGRAA